MAIASTEQTLSFTAGGPGVEGQSSKFRKEAWRPTTKVDRLVRVGASAWYIYRPRKGQVRQTCTVPSNPPSSGRRFRPIQGSRNNHGARPLATSFFRPLTRTPTSLCTKQSCTVTRDNRRLAQRDSASTDAKTERDDVVRQTYAGL